MTIRSLALLTALAIAVPCAARADHAASISRNIADGSSIVIGRSFEIASTALRGARTINVYLPATYGKTARKFPVLVLLDGGEQEDFLHIAGLSQITSAYGQGQEMIVVGVAGSDRRHDLTTISLVPADLKAAPTAGGALAYRRFLVDELKPWVAARYRTDGHYAIIGESLAGLFVLETFLDEPRAFSDYIAVSPSLWWNGGKVLSETRDRLKRHDYTGRRLWVGFEAPSPPEDEAVRDRRRQSELEASFAHFSPAGLWWKFVRTTEGHASIYHPAALQAFRDLYGIRPAGR